MKEKSDVIIERLAYLIIILSVIAFIILSVTAVKEEELSFFIIALSEMIGSFIVAVFMLGFSRMIENSNDIAENSIESLNYQRKIYEYLYSNNDKHNKNEVKAISKVKTGTEKKEKNINCNSDDLILECDDEIVDEAGVIASLTEHEIQISDDDSINDIGVEIYLKFEIIGNVNNGLGLFTPVLSCFDNDDNLVGEVKLISNIVSGTATVNTKMTIEDKNKTDNKTKLRFVISG